MSKTFSRKEYDELDETIGKYRQRKDERQGHNPYYTYKKRKAERRKMREDARWITIGAMPGDGRNMPKMKGRHVLIDDEGEVISGAGGSLTGVKLEGAESTSGDVKVDPSKTSDPKPTSPAGDAGKSSSEVAAEAKETETVSKGEETASVGKAASKEFDISKFVDVSGKAVEEDDEEAWHDALKDAPVGTKIIHGEDVLKKASDGNFYLAGFELPGMEFKVGEMPLPKDTFGWKIEDPETGEVIDLGKSTGETGTESKEAKETKKGSWDDTAEWAKKALKDEVVEAWDSWLADAPVGTGVIKHTDFGDEYYYKEEDGWYYEDEKLVDDEELTFEDVDELEDYKSKGYGISLVSPETGEMITALEIGPKLKAELEKKGLMPKTEGSETETKEAEEKTASEEQEQLYKDMTAAFAGKDTLASWMDKAPIDAEISFCDEDGTPEYYFRKTIYGWKSRPTDYDALEEFPEKYYESAEEAAADFMSFKKDAMEHGMKDWNAEVDGYMVSGKFDDKPEEPEATTEDKPYEEKKDMENVIASGSYEAISKLVSNFDDGTELEFDFDGNLFSYKKTGKNSWTLKTKLKGKDWEEHKGYEDDVISKTIKASKTFKANGKEYKSLYHAWNPEILALKKEDKDYWEDAAYDAGIAKHTFAGNFVNFKGDKYTVINQGDGSYTVDNGSSIKKMDLDNLVKLIKNEDLWFKDRFAEPEGSAISNKLYNKDLPGIKKSIVSTGTTKPSLAEFKDTFRHIPEHSTFQMRNTDGNGLIVRKLEDDTGYAGYIVKTVDKDGNIGKTELYTSEHIEDLYNKLTNFPQKGVTFNNLVSAVPYVAPTKKPKTPGYKGPADSSSHATEEKASSGLTKVSFSEDAYGPAARKSAIQEPGTPEGKKKVHEKLMPGMTKWWKGLSHEQHNAIKAYTGSYHDTNEPLRGFTYTSSTKGDEHITEKIKAIDDALDKSTLEEPIVLSRGISMGTFAAMVQHKSSAYSKYSSSDFGADLIGKELTEPSYLSCTAAGKADFSGKRVQLKIYCPTGTKGAYINPVSMYGMALFDPEHDYGKSPASGTEFEFLLQRGSKFKVRDIKQDASGRYQVELDLVEQNPRKVSISGKKGIYADGKDAYDF